MNTAMAIPGNTASTFLTHFFGSGLADERYVVEWFKAQADGDIPRRPASHTGGGGCAAASHPPGHVPPARRPPALAGRARTPVRRMRAPRASGGRPAAAGGTEPPGGARPMTAQTLPDEPDFVFCPEELPEDELQRIAIVVEGMNGAIPTALVTLTATAALRICDRLNRRLGHRDRDSWTAFAARRLGAGASRSGIPD